MSTAPERLREAIVRLTREQADRTDLIESLWMLFAHHLEVPTGGTQWIEGRRCFFAGARTIFEAVMFMLEPGDDATDADLSRMDNLWKELERFDMDLRQGTA